MRSGYRIFDTHTHLGVAAHSGREMRVEAMLAHMDACGVDRCLLIPWPVVESEREAHEEIAAALRRYPERFRGAACLHPFQPRERFLEELDRCVESGLGALKLQPQFQPLNPMNPRHDWYWEAALERSLPVVVHTGNGAPLALPSIYIAAARRFPGLTIVIGHAGGPVYYQEAILASQLCPNVYVEVSTLPAHVTADVVRQVPVERLLCGSDLPESTAVEIDKLLGLGIEKAALEEILFGNAERLFR